MGRFGRKCDMRDKQDTTWVRVVTAGISSLGLVRIFLKSDFWVSGIMKVMES